MLKPFFVFLIALGFGLASAGPSRAQTAAEGAALAQALAQARAERWSAASARIARAQSPAAADVVLWLRLRASEGSWPDYRAFLARNPDWPGLATVRAAGERQMPEALPPGEVVAYFDGAYPETGAGALRLANALAQSGDTGAAEAEIVRAWLEIPMGAAEQAAILRDWRETVAPHHWARTDRMLWAGETRTAERMLPLADADHQALAQARIGVRRDIDGSTALIQAVPRALRDDPGLAFERYLYRIDAGRWEDAESYIAERSNGLETLGRPEMWMERRANFARQALRRGDVDRAYEIAARSFGSEGADYSDAEWLAGYIALRFQDDPTRAVAHFLRFQTAVFTPISLGRAGYWLGLAHERAGDPDAARAAYLVAAQHQTSFYGQLAAERAGVGADPRLAGTGVAPEWRGTAMAGRSVVQAALLLGLAGDDAQAAVFWRQATEGQSAETRGALAQMAADNGQPHIGIRIAKDAAADGIVLPDQYYPSHALAEDAWAVPTEFALAVARQESELNPEAESSVGARGLMQLMPATARAVASQAGLVYDASRLTGDALYNVRLGTDYLAQMLARYDGSYVLATAAYNAGPGRVDQWIASFGDPRRSGIDAIDWIETIPFTETRNYVMRVLEGLHVYRARLQGRSVPIRLAQDINRTG